MGVALATPFFIKILFSGRWILRFSFGLFQIQIDKNRLFLLEMVTCDHLKD